MRDAQRAYYLALIARLQGRAGRIWIPSFDHVQRGAFSAPELLTNNDFGNGTTGWAADFGTLAVSNRVARLKFSGVSGNPAFHQDPSVTQYAAYAARALVQKLASSASLTAGAFLNNGIYPGPSATYISQGLSTLSLVTIGSGTTNGFYVLVSQNSGFIAGEFMDVSWTSMARCLLVDNGPNALLRSDEFDNAAWTKNKATISANTGLVNAPDGAATADMLVEDNTSGQHYATQAFTVAAAAADYCFCIAVRASTRSFCEILLAEGTGGTSVSQYFNLSTGAVGTTGATGANWANRRAFIRDLGNSWYLCCVVGRKTNAATSINATVLSATADGTDSYLGTSVSAIALWRATAAQSSVPVRLTQTTTTATTGTAQTGGALYVKGGRTPSEGALAGAIAEGDLVEVVLPTYSQLVRAIAPLDLDAAGNGYLQFEPGLRQAPADGAAIIINSPMGRFMLGDQAVEWSNDLLMFSNAAHSFVESVQ